MKKYISAKREIGVVSGKIAETGEPCKMRMTGYWTGAQGKHISSYERIDKEVEYDDQGRAVYRQYSMDRHHRFWVETEDRI